MSDAETFADLLRRVRAGDEQAATELVRQYEPLIRREVRVRLSDPGLCRLLDSMDICQSVMASFFLRAAAGQFDLDQPDHLVRLLIGMARNKLASAARQQHAQRRDNRRTASTPVDEVEQTAGIDPARLVAGQDLLQEVRKRLSAEERDLADRRVQGQEWPAIAAEMGGTAEGRRKQLARALDRVANQLGLEEEELGSC